MKHWITEKQKEVKLRLRSSKVFVFDYYNTLVIDDVMSPPVWQHLNELGYKSSEHLQMLFEPDAFDGYLTPGFDGNPSHEAWCNSNWRRLLKASGVPDHEEDSVLQSILERQKKNTAIIAPQAIELLNYLKSQGCRIGLCSNWESPIENCLKQVGLALDLFDTVTISAAVGARKPHPQIFDTVCQNMNIMPKDAVFVGDNWSTDIGGALRLGFLPVWLRYDRPSHHSEHVVPEYNSIGDLFLDILS